MAHNIDIEKAAYEKGLAEGYKRGWLDHSDITVTGIVQQPIEAIVKQVNDFLIPRMKTLSDDGMNSMDDTTINYFLVSDVRKALDMLAALQPIEAIEDGWISAETPPEDEENVLVLSDRMNGYQYGIYMGWISLKQWYILCDDGVIKDYNNNADHCTITHWQPLPLPPKK